MILAAERPARRGGVLAQPRRRPTGVLVAQAEDDPNAPKIVMDAPAVGFGQALSDSLAHQGAMPAQAPFDIDPAGLLSGMGRSSQPGQGIRAYHVSPYDFEQFNPDLSYRKASFFAMTPKQAAEGASAGGRDYYMPRKGVGRDITYEVDIRPDYIKGLRLTPKERSWWEALPKYATEAQVDAIMNAKPSNRIDYWWRVYDEKNNGDGTFSYVKLPVPELSYEQAAKTDRDVYGRQFPHYGHGEADIASRVKREGMSGWAVQDEAGLSLAIVDPTIIRILRKFGLPITAGGASIAAGMGLLDESGTAEAAPPRYRTGRTF